LRLVSLSAKRVRGVRANARRGFPPGYPERAKPKGAAGVARPKPPRERKGLPKGSKPRSRSLPGRPSASCGSKNGGRNGMWVLRRGNAAETFRKEKAPKGKSQERCRCETKPARAGRAKTVKRVAKPWRRIVAGRHAPRLSGSPGPQVLKGTKAHERSRPAAAGRLGFAATELCWRQNPKRVRAAA
jgi:hypothetical protein